MITPLLVLAEQKMRKYFSFS